MRIALALMVGGLYAAGLYMVLRRNLAKLVLGLGLLSHAANLLIFVGAGVTRATPPIVPAAATGLTGRFADPVPQALILTAIVIGFAIQAFALILVWRVHQTTGAADVDELRVTDT